MRNILSYKMFEEISNDYWYHGSDSKFDEFKEIGEHTKPTSKFGYWFSKTEGFAKNFGEIIYKFKLDYNNPYRISFDKWDEMRMEYHDNAKYFENLRNKLIKEGYDSFLIEGKKEIFAGVVMDIPDVIAVFEKSQIIK